MLCVCVISDTEVFFNKVEELFYPCVLDTKGEKLGRDLRIIEKLKATNMLSHIACHALEEFSMASVNML